MSAPTRPGPQLDQPPWYLHVGGPTFIRRWWTRLGAIDDMLAEPCEIGGDIWVKAFFQEIPTLIWSITKPDPNDLVFDRAGFGHKLRRRWNFKFDSNNMIRGLLTQIEHESWALFRLGELAQRAGFYFMLLDAGIDFTYNWVTTAYQYAGCQTHEFYVAADYNDADNPAGFGFGSAPVPFDLVTESASGLYSSPNIFIPAHKTAFIRCSATLTPRSSFNIPGVCGLRIAVDLSQELNWVIEPQLVDTDHHPSGSTGVTVPPAPIARFASVIVECPDATCNLTNGSSFAMSSRNPGRILADP